MLIQENCYAIIQKVGGDHLRLRKIKKGNKILIEKLSFNINDAIGCPFGLFEVISGNLVPCLPNTFIPSSSNGFIESSAAISQDERIKSGDNGQKVTHEEIVAMKKTGVSTSDLVSRLVDGNQTYGDRTIYSQQKYVRKKSSKHSDKVLISKPNIRLLAECYYKRDPDRFGNFRSDHLALMLQLAAIHKGSIIAIYDQVLGILAAAIIERLAGDGACVFLHRGDRPQSIPCIESMEFSDEQLEVFYPLRIDLLLSGTLKNVNEIFDAEDKRIKEEEPSTMDVRSGNSEIVNEEDEDGECGLSSRSDPEQILRRKERIEREQKALSLFCSESSDCAEFGEIDCLCFAVRTTSPTDILKRTYQSLRLSGTIVIFSAIREHLLEAYEWLREKGALNLQLSDQFYREYQVLDQRTHPLMQQLIAGGYLLSGIKVKPAI